MFNLITEKDCKEILDKLQPDINKTLIRFEVTKFNENCMGFLGDHFRLTIYYKQGDGEKKTNFFLKCVPQSNANASDYINGMGVYQKEILQYQRLLPDMQKLVSTVFCPKCYFGKYDGNYLVLEDLREQGYAVSKYDTFSSAEIDALLKTLSAFHAASVVYEERRSTNGRKYRLDDDFKGALREGTFSPVEGHPRYKWAKTAVRTITDCASLLPQFANEKKLGEKIAKQLQLHISEAIKPSEVFRNVVTHDDLWRKNILFRNENGSTECILVDFQLTRYGPPALDVLLALYLNVSSKELRVIMPQLLASYYEYFSNELKRSGVNPNETLTKEEFIRSIEFYRLPALFETVIYGTNVFVGQQLSDLIVSNEDVYNDFVYGDRSKYVCREFQENDTFRRRIVDVLEPFIERLMAC